LLDERNHFTTFITPKTNSKEDEMRTLEKAVQAVEEGLLTANRIQGRPKSEFSLVERMAHFHVPGFSIALVDHKEIVWAKGYGITEAGGSQQITEETIFQAASISKPVTAMVALHLVEAGALDLDVDVNQALRSWKILENEHTREKKVTLRGLLSHTAGVSVMGYRGYPAGTKLPNLIQILEGEPPANSEPVRVTQPPGKAFSYSGGGYVLAQVLLEDVTGKRLADLAQEIIFDKLGMTNSTFEHLLPENFVPQAATAHLDNGEPVPGKWHIYPENAPASLWSTPTDLAGLAIEVLKSNDGESSLVLSPEMTREMLTPQVGWVGLGFPIIEVDGITRFDHPGWNEGYHSSFIGYPGSGQGVVWMANGENGKLLGFEVMRGLAAALGWPGFPQAEKVVASIDADVLAACVGSYRYVDYPDFGVEIIRDGKQLVLVEPPESGSRYRLYPESETGFFCLDRPEGFSFNLKEGEKYQEMVMGQYTHLERAE
jgi:CubicO group peptidase (beta-lactamase class C family)